MRSIFTLLISFLLTLVAFDAKASLDIDVSEPNLEITTGFSGDTLTIFGTADIKGDIIIIVKGPERQTTIRRKSNILGLWLNADSVTFDNVPGYYNVASSKPVFDIASQKIRLENRIGINGLTFQTDADIETAKYERFQEALIQNKQLSGLYSLTPKAVVFINDTLFKTRIYMPSNVPIGDYEIEAFLFQKGQIIDRKSQIFQIAQGGLAGDVHNFAYNRPLLYGVVTILIALFSSFLAVTLLRRD